MNILFVDDQPSVLASILSAVNWRQQDFQNVYTAGSVPQAREIFRQHPVDILVTDIEMPGEDGLSLVSWVREQQYAAECIVLTSHADFFYAKTAISLGILDYVVQPAHTEDILRAVLAARNKINRERFQRMRIRVDSMTSAAQNQSIRSFFETWPDPRAITQTPQGFQERLGWLREYTDGQPQDAEIILYSFRISRFNAIPPAPDKMIQHYTNLLYQNLSERAQKTLSWYRDSSCIYTLIFFNTGTNTEALFGELLKKLSSGMKCRAGIVFIKARLSTLHSALVTLDNPEFEIKETGVREVFLPKNAGPETRNVQFYFQQIRDYIQMHMDEPLSRAQIAEDLHLSANYVGNIIRACAGKSSKEYITEIKMNYARKLVLDSFDSIGEIAKKCGYDSFAYFSKVYKDFYSLTPSDDRKRLGN